MITGPESEFDAIAQAAGAMSLAWAQDDKTLLSAAVNALKNRPGQSPIANAAGQAIENVLRLHGMLP